MNAVEFIEELVTQGQISNLSAKNAFEAFEQQVGKGVASYGYFRTKFNNRKKELGVISSPQAEPIRAILPDIEPEPEPEKAVRKIVNYSDGNTKITTMGLMPTGTKFDELISDRITTEEEKQRYFDRTGEEMPEDMIEIGGFTRKCVDITAGPAGSGKTFSRCSLAAMAKIYARREQGKELRVGFISGEMRKAEWDKEVKASPLLKELEVDFMLDYVGYPNYEEIFWEAFGDYDIVVVDSLPAIISHFKMSWDPSRGKMPTETNMIFQFIRKALASVEENDNNVQLINQANKDGNYKGGTELPHMMSSMSFVRIDGQSRYMMFDKNRNNGKTCKRKLFFSKAETGELVFNEEAYDATYNKVNDKQQTLDEFINGLDDSEREKLNKLGEEGSATTMSPEEMGDSERNTKEELRELDNAFGDSIPAHLREDNPPTAKYTTSEGQLDLEDNIAAVEFEQQQNDENDN